MKKLIVIFIVLLLLPSAGSDLINPPVASDEEQVRRLELVGKIKAFEKTLGFKETENFRYYSEKTEAFDYHYFTSRTALPYSFEDPLLQWGVGSSESVSIDRKKYDVFYYSVEAVAGVKTPVTGSLLKAPLPRFIHVIFHEDWHEQIDLPNGIEEPAAEVVGYGAALLFAGDEFGRDSAVYRTLEAEYQDKLKESKIYGNYHQLLDTLYTSFKSGEVLEAQTLSRKADLLASLGDDLEQVWGGRPDQLNNAYLAFQITYSRHFPLMYELYLATGSDLAKTIEIFLAMPHKGVKFKDVDELKGLEGDITGYLEGVLRQQSRSPMSYPAHPINLSLTR